MLRYITRRILYAIPILVGVSLLTFVLFYMSATPEQMARRNLSAKNPTPTQIHQWVVQRGYDKPRPVQFAKHMSELFLLKFGKTDSIQQEDIWDRIKRGAPVSFQVASLIFLGSIVCSVSFALGAAYFRGTYIDLSITLICVFMLSVVYMLYIITGQFLLGKLLRLFPLAGYREGLISWKFVWIPMLVGIANSIPGSTRYYRTFMLDEMNLDYVRTARAKGVSEAKILFHHVLKNAAVPILTTVVAAIPSLFLGSILVESFFSIPGLGGFLKDAILGQDFAVVRAMTFLGTILTIIGYLLTDISYGFVDPRVRLE